MSHIILTPSRSYLSPLKTHCTTAQPITSLEFSSFRRDLVVATGEDGCVRMWDVQASLSPIHTFDAAHYGSVRGGIAFSPYNRYLMASAGLDKRVVLYDVDKKV